METLHELQARIGSFAPGSLYFSDVLSTKDNEKLTCKVGEDGRLKPFPGNTIVFMLGEDEREAAKEIRNRLYANRELAEALFTLEPLKPETLHMTLHDLANPTTLKHGYTVENTREHALDMLAEIKRDFTRPIQMKPRWMSSMLNISILLGLEPVDEENCRRLMEMYERFHDVVCPDYARLTPHITLAYYRPMEASAEQLNGLRAILDDFNQSSGERPIFELRPDMLVYQEFEDMNSYKTVEKV